MDLELNDKCRIKVSVRSVVRAMWLLSDCDTSESQSLVGRSESVNPHKYACI